MLRPPETVDYRLRPASRPHCPTQNRCAKHIARARFPSCTHGAERFANEEWRIRLLPASRPRGPMQNRYAKYSVRRSLHHWRRRDSNTPREHQGKRRSRRVGAAKSAAFEPQFDPQADRAAASGTGTGRALPADLPGPGTRQTPPAGSGPGAAADSSPAKPAGGDFAEALALIARLPGLTDAERAEAVRRLLAARVSGG